MAFLYEIEQPVLEKVVSISRVFTALCISQFQAWPSPRATPGIRTFSLPGGSGFRPTIFAREVGVLN